jgi:hypothetical protein
MIAIEPFRKAMHRIASQKGDFTLFALFRRANGLGRWDLVVSAPWLEKGKSKAFSELVDLLAKSIDKRSFLQLARVEPIPSNNPTVKFILANIPVDDGERRIQSTDLFDLQIDEAIILRAKRPQSKKPTARALQPVGTGMPASRR